MKSTMSYSSCIKQATSTRHNRRVKKSNYVRKAPAYSARAFSTDMKIRKAQ